MKGFTLIETLAVVAITGLVGVGLLGMIAYFYRSNAFLLESTSAVDSASRGLRESIALVREASYSEEGAYPIAVAATSSLTFYADTDNDLAVERVRLYVQNGTFYRTQNQAAGSPPSYGATSSPATIATWVKNATSTPVFRYYDDAGLEILPPVEPARVRRISARLDVDINPLRAPNILVLEGGATVRNLRTD
jgi:Tfp pilus assembly protein PilV